MMPHGRNHQREFPAQHAAKIVGIDLIPRDHPRQWMNEDIHAEIGRRLPERTQLLSVEPKSLQLRGDHHAGKA